MGNSKLILGSPIDPPEPYPAASAHLLGYRQSQACCPSSFLCTGALAFSRKLTERRKHGGLGMERGRGRDSSVLYIK